MKPKAFVGIHNQFLSAESDDNKTSCQALSFCIQTHKISAFSPRTTRTCTGTLQQTQKTTVRRSDLKSGSFVFERLWPCIFNRRFSPSSDRYSRHVSGMCLFKGWNLFWLSNHEGIAGGLQSTCPPAVRSGNQPRPQMVTGEWEDLSSHTSTFGTFKPDYHPGLFFDINLTG